MRELSKFYYYVGKKLADLKKSSREKVIDENAKKRRQNSDKNKSKKSKSSEETDERSEEDVNVEDEDSRLYDYPKFIHRNGQKSLFF